MSTEEQDLITGRLIREATAASELRRVATERVLQTASELRDIAHAMNGSPKEAIRVLSKISTATQNYVNTRQLFGLIKEEQEAIEAESDYAARVKRAGL